ncbi:DeoR/GlpR family DNA-binding transcription regulator [Jonesia quinghaiensis]|uniref:DeoR/GlpR family DNA-binding transcription regulator n=1 Tax=Jonesia quinghaiensis TaxID=262806 RepID=UPI00042080BE|nr:DeoR/GlpR family DNA-binding transcription regulator [Jonesia quinghaiensis]
MYAPERHTEILSRARSAGRVEVTALATDLDVTQETIRRDLTALERRGLLRRVHGGAIPVERLGLEPAVSEREHTNPESKDAISRAALNELPENGSILLDAGTTTVRLAALIPHDAELVVVTHAIAVANALSNHPGITLHLVGGQVRGRTLAAVGPWALAALQNIHVDVAFVGTNGLSVERGLTTPDIDEAEVKRALVRAARRTVVMADHSKLGRDEFASFAPVTAIDTLITDATAETEILRDLDLQGVTVVQA